MGHHRRIKAVAQRSARDAADKDGRMARLQDEVAVLTATVEVEQRVALHKMQASSTKGRDRESRSTGSQTDGP